MCSDICSLWVYFIIYSICGWILESFYRSICERKIINTGFLYGPFCPIYGAGSVIMIILLERFQDNILILYSISFILLSAWEYIVGYLLEKIFKNKYWDYSDHKINIHGRVCITNSICWGILGVLFIKYIHPFTEKTILALDGTALRWFFAIITIIFIVDTIISIIKVKNINATFKKIEDLNKQIKYKIEEIKNFKSKDYKLELINNMQGTIEKLNKKKNRMFRRLYRRVYRLKKAFPNIDSKVITEILNKRVELIKKDNKKR